MSMVERRLEQLAAHRPADASAGVCELLVGDHPWRAYPVT